MAKTEHTRRSGVRGLISRLRRRAGGQSLVEFVLVLPLLLVIVFGIVEFGNLWRTYQIATNAAREGAREAVVVGTTDSDVDVVIDNYLSNSGLNPGNATYVYNDGAGLCDPATGASCAGALESVRVEYPFGFSIFSGVVELLCDGCGANYGSVTLKTEAVMRHE